MNSISLHKKLQGKLCIKSKISLKKPNNLSALYTPGVGQVVRYISKNKKSVYDLTIKKNTIAVVTDGSAVLGMGNVGPLAALPVMEGKCAIFSEFSGLNAFPICLDTQNTEKIVQTVKYISPVFAAINLEDISAPRCFEIERRLQKTLDIPVMHDDQHATAIVVLAGLLNATKIVKKKLVDSKIVILGAGAAGNAIAKLLSSIFINNIIVVDSEGIISNQRKNLTPEKKALLKITNPNNIVGNLLLAAKCADILIGVSRKGLLTEEIVSKMKSDPIIFALANPDPEITPNLANKIGVRVIATGRSDYLNQINNALVFPGFFKGLIEGKKREITIEMKIKTATALASLIKNPTEKYFIPSIFDKRVIPTITESVKY